jgi:uncharacterized protein involved in outer membrane biogenesis
LAISLFLDGSIKRGIETIGPKLTGVDIRLDNVSLSLLSGSGAIKGLVVGNPEGFKTPQAIRVGNASLALQPGSLLSDKIIIKSIKVEAPEITFEGGFGGNNLRKILSNLQSIGGGTGTNAPAKEQGPGKKLEVDDFSISGAKLSVSLTRMGGESIPVVLPEIHLTDLGKGPDGITSADLMKVVLAEVEKAAVKAANKAVADLGKNATALTQDFGKGSTGAVETLKKGLGGLFKKK